MAKLTRLSSLRSDRGPVQVSIVLVGLCLSTGFYGWVAVDYDWPDALYRALLALGASDIYTNSHEWCGPSLQGSECQAEDIKFASFLALNVARFSGLVFLFAAVLFTLANLLSRTLAQFRADLGGRRLVCIGDGDLTGEAFQSEAATDLKRVWLGAPVPQNQIRSVTLPWNVCARPGRTVGKAVRGAKNVFLCAGNDVATLQHIAAVAKNVKDSKGKPVSITAIFEKMSAAEEALRIASPVFESSKSAMRCLTYSGLTAREILRAQPPFALADKLQQTTLHVMIVGFGRVGQSLLKDIAINCTTSQFGKPHITVVDPVVAKKQAWIKNAIPELDEICSFTAFEGGFGAAFEPPSEALDDLPPLTAVYICVGSGDLALEALDGLRVWFRNQKRRTNHIFVRTNSIDFGSITKQEDASSLQSFGTFKAILREAQYLSGDPDALARRYHEVYCESSRALDSRAKSQSWLDLPEPFKASNRAVVDHLQTKIFSANLDQQQCLDEHGHIKQGCNAVLFSNEDELEALAALEHRRFVTERRTSGWSKGERNNELRKDPNFIDYSELSDELKSIDRLIVELSKTLLRDG